MKKEYVGIPILGESKSIHMSSCVPNSDPGNQASHFWVTLWSRGENFLANCIPPANGASQGHYILPKNHKCYSIVTCK